uniref:Endoglucanase n=1 Tax=Dictyostelium discoideum TaxID=44689 RepID=UPI001FE2431F|nr:Chain A, Endoglucanase [Dictyostelium discoideum]7T7Z_A Chain A, Endoglucanase [Dictyostelium discoideum]
GAMGESLSIYKSGLKNDFQDWSWGEHSLTDTTNVESGETNSISFTPKAYGAVFLGCFECIDTDTYNNIEFDINGGSSGAQLLRITVVKNSKSVGSKLITDLNGGTPIEANSWTKIKASFIDDFKVSGKVDGIWIQDIKGDTQSTVYISNIIATA